MLPSERHRKILDLLATRDIVTIPDLLATFPISIETLRRDLTQLENQGMVEKVYGGAKLKSLPLSEPSLESRMTDRLPLKAAIGKACRPLIRDGDCIFIDSGSTTYHITHHLAGLKNLTIITNSLPAITQLIGGDWEVIIIGGRIRHRERSVVTQDYLFNFSELNIQKCFLCAGGISIDNGISDFDLQEAVTKKKIISRSREVFVAADSSKFDRDVPIHIVPLDKVHGIITDSCLDPAKARAFRQTGIELMIAPD